MRRNKALVDIIDQKFHNINMKWMCIFSSHLASVEQVRQQIATWVCVHGTKFGVLCGKAGETLSFRLHCMWNVEVDKLNYVSGYTEYHLQD